MATRYRYFIAFTQTTAGPRGETVMRNDVLNWPKPIEDGEDIEALEGYLSERSYVPTSHVLLTFILLGEEEDETDR